MPHRDLMCQCGGITPPPPGLNGEVERGWEEFLERVFEGRMGLMLNTMVERKALSGTEIQELYEILRQAEEARGDGKESGKDGEEV